MPTYESEVAASKQYVGNVVIAFGGKYFCIRQPDSGLGVAYPYSHMVESLVLNPTTINPRQVNTTISSTSFKIVDKNGIVSRLVQDRAEALIGTEVTIWLGRTGVGMAFSDYKQLPIARLAKVQKSGASYTFTTRDSTERMNRPLFDARGFLAGDILAATTTITADAALTDFPTSGMIRIGTELITYTGKAGNSFTGCGRGAYGTVAAEHALGAEFTLADTITGNPIDILLSLLTSGSGSGSYDTLNDGLAISPSLIDVAEMESIRDENFPDTEFSLAFYDMASALKFIEKELLAPCKLRFTAKNDLLTVALLDTARFIDTSNVLDHDSIVGEPALSIQDIDVQNKITINWNYDEGESRYQSKSIYTDDASIATYGLSASPLEFSFKGVQSQAFIDDFAADMLERYAIPSPEVQVKTQMDKSLLTVGDKALLNTDRLPNSNGELAFADSLEVVSRAINWQNGEVTLKLAYTTFTGTRLGWICPSDQIAVVTSQSVVEVAAGRGLFWEVGWKVRLWDTVNKVYLSDATNEIASITGDEITFVNSWTTALTTDYMLVFPDFDEATTSQRRYAFVGINDSDFSRSEKVYSIVP